MKRELVVRFIEIKIFSFYKRRKAVRGIRFVRRYGRTENFFLFLYKLQAFCPRLCSGEFSYKTLP